MNATVKAMPKEQSEFLGDVLTSAIEGGSTFWAEGKAFEYDGDGRPIRFKIRADAEETDPERRKWKTVTRAMIHDGIYKMMHGEVEVGNYIAAQFIGYPYRLDQTNHDAEGADAAVQVAVFGEIVYG